MIKVKIFSCTMGCTQSFSNGSDLSEDEKNDMIDNIVYRIKNANKHFTDLPLAFKMKNNKVVSVLDFIYEAVQKSGYEGRYCVMCTGNGYSILYGKEV